MSRHSPFPAAALLVAMLLGVPAAPVLAQDYPSAAVDDRATFTTEELDQILAPIALYPDDLLSSVLMAATYPLEVVEAARWIDEPENRDLKGAALERALADKDWDPSVKSLAQFPDVLMLMDDNLDWMRKLGDAVLADQAAVMDRIQFLRMKAEEAGHLESNQHQRIVNRREDDRDYIYIEPAEPDVIYVPVYEPDVVYGSWWYPDYPPYYWEPAGVVFVDYFYWGAGVAIAPALWHWASPRWHRHYIHVDPRRYNRLSRHKLKASVNRWHHDARHRRGARYHDPKLRRRFQKESIKGARTNTRLRDPATARRDRDVRSRQDRGPGTYQRNLRAPRVDRGGERRRNFDRRKDAKPNAGKRSDGPAVKKRVAPNKPASRPNRIEKPKVRSQPNRQIKKRPPPQARSKPAVRKRPSGVKQHRAGPPRMKKPSAGKPRGQPKVRAPGGGGRKVGPPRGGGGKPSGKGRGKKKD